MADRYWVGGTGTWSSINILNWSVTSGGVGGASVPTAADVARFNVNSGSGIVTFTNSGVSTANTVIDNIGIELSLNGAFSTGGILVTAGIFTTNNYSVSAAQLSSSNTNIRTINLGSSTVSCFGSPNPVLFTISTGLTFNCGTSSITCVNNSNTFTGGGQTFYNVSFTGVTQSFLTINGTNTFNNLSVTGRTTAGINNTNIGADQTINGTLTLSAGGDGTCRTFVRSDVIGTTRTLTCASFSGTDIDFRDITIAGAAAPVSGTRLGDCKGNSGITFPAAKTVYWNSPFASQSWSSGYFALSIGGGTSANNFPLAQDTFVVPSSSPTSGGTVTINAAYNIGTIDMSARTTNTMTLARGAQAPAIYGDWINGTGVTLTGTGMLTFAGRGSQTITSAGRSFTGNIVVDSPSGSVTFQDAFTGFTSNFTLTSGTLDANIYNVTASVFTSIGANTRIAAIGSGMWTLSSSSGVWSVAATNLTVTGTGIISLTNASAKTFNGGNIQTYPTLNQGGTGTLTVIGSNKFAGLTNTAIGRIQFTGGTTNEFTSFVLNGTAVTSFALGSTNTTQANLKKTTPWQMGLLSTDAGNNTGLIFSSSDGTMEYLTVSYINGMTGGNTYNVDWSDTSTVTDSSVSSVAFTSVTFETANSADIFSVAASIFSAPVTESSAATDSGIAYSVFPATVDESGGASDAMQAGKGYTVYLNEFGTASDSILASSGYFVFLDETATAAVADVGYIAFPGVVAEAAAVADDDSASAIFDAQVGLLLQPMSELALGTSAAGSLIFDSGSFSNGAEIEPNGTGTGSSGGFNLGGNYLGFSGGANPFFSPSATMPWFDFTDVNYVEVTLIAADGTNGAPFYGADMEITYSYLLPGPIFGNISLAYITVYAASTPITILVPIPAGVRSDQGRIQFSLSTQVPLGFGPVWGIKDINLYYGAMAATDKEATKHVAYPVVTELAGITDSADAPGSTYNPSLTEAATAADSDVGYITYPTTIAEAITSLDAYAASSVFIGTLAEAVAATDAGSTKVVFYAALTEAAAAVDLNAVAASVFNAPFADTVGVVAVTDAPGSTYNASVLVVLTVSDAIVGAFLWNPIDDTQDANWQNVGTVQAPGWTAVDTTQLPGWVNIEI